MEKTQIIHAPCDGKVIPLRQVGDPIFSQRLAGDGAAIIPSSNQFLAPCDGTIKLIFKGSHALVIEKEDGINLMVHIGINTVALNGLGFTAHVKRGDKVKLGDVLVEVDQELINSKNIDLTTVLLINESRDLRSLVVKQNGWAKQKETVLITYEVE